MAGKKRPPKDESVQGSLPQESNKEPKQPESVAFEAPVISTYTVERVGGGWCVAKYKLQGDTVLGVERTTADMKAIAVERFKIMIANEVLKE